MRRGVKGLKCPWCPTMVDLDTWPEHASKSHGARIKAEPDTKPVVWAGARDPKWDMESNHPPRKSPKRRDAKGQAVAFAESSDYD